MELKKFKKFYHISAVLLFQFQSESDIALLWQKSELSWGSLLREGASLDDFLVKHVCIREGYKLVFDKFAMFLLVFILALYYELCCKSWLN